MSCDFWGVLGRYTCDASFRSELFPRSVGRASQMNEAEALYGYLTSQGYRLDRYHFMEVNRVLTTVLPDGVMAGAPGGPFERVGRHVEALRPLAAVHDDLYAVIGVSYIDRPLRADLHAAALGGDERAFTDILARPPGFRLAAVNHGWLRELYARPAVVAALTEVNDWAWHIPLGTPIDDRACDAGLTLHGAYRHTPQVERRRMRLELPALRRRVLELGGELALPLAA